jgi:hypothetical protein
MRSGKAVSASVALPAAALALAPAARAGELVLATSQLGFKPDSPKTLTLVAPEEATLPDRIPFYIHQAGYSLPRDQKKPGLWADAWLNYGGDKCWVWPEDDWATRSGKYWPPPTDRPGAITHQAEIVEGPALRLVSPTAWGLVRLPEDERSPEDVAARLRTR